MINLKQWTKKHPRLARASLVAALVAALGTASVVAIGTTGAYFSDTKNGTVTGSLGTIKVTTNGGTGADNADLKFANPLLPGEAQTVSVTFTNSGTSVQDVWVVFPNATALSSLNDLGSYGEVHVTANGTPVFDSANLSDHSSSCGAFSPAGCWPLPNKLKLASNVGPGNTGNMKFTFNYAGKLKNSSNVDGAKWNMYPATDGQTTINDADGTGNGLPYQIVAVQHGQTP